MTEQYGFRVTDYMGDVCEIPCDSRADAEAEIEYRQRVYETRDARSGDVELVRRITPDGPWLSLSAASASDKVTLRLIEHGERTIDVDRAEYEAAKAAGELDQYLDVDASNIDSDTTVVEPDGTEIKLWN